VATELHAHRATVDAHIVRPQDEARCASTEEFVAERRDRVEWLADRASEIGLRQNRDESPSVGGFTELGADRR
jgi:hypothetical protein